MLLEFQPSSTRSDDLDTGRYSLPYYKKGSIFDCVDYLRVWIGEPPFKVQLIYEVCGGIENSPVTPVLESLTNVTKGEQIYLEIFTDGIKKYEDFLKINDAFKPKVVRPECCAYDCDLKYSCRNCPVDNGFVAMTLEFSTDEAENLLVLNNSTYFSNSTESKRRKRRSIFSGERTSNYHLDSWSDWMDYGEPSGILMLCLFKNVMIIFEN